MLRTWTDSFRKSAANTKHPHPQETASNQITGRNHIPLVRQLQIKFPVRMRKDHTQLSPAKIEAQAHSRPLAEGNKILLEFFRLIALPALGFEDVGFGEDGLVVVDEP